ncbi:MAG: NADH-quinone oxidoreductase subunit N, partial [Dehalococcoidia bacterium]|nr:NADH-quinone oxidoreductase subunit N [Dehalococcoidia bacterium]
MDLLLTRRAPRLIPAVAILGLVTSCFVLVALWDTSGEVASIYRVDMFSTLLKLSIVVMAIVVIAISVEYCDRFLPQTGEYYGLVLFATLGAMVLCSATEIITAYVGLEVLNFSLYVLTGYAKWNPRSNEASVKYLLLGAVSSAVLLYGVSLLYGVTTTTSFRELNLLLSAERVSFGVIVSLAFILTGVLFKVAAAPFHVWAPDVYEGAPTPVTAFLSVAAKAAGFAFLLRFVVDALPSFVAIIAPALAFVSALTMIVGNTVAIRQTNIKRMLAYSSVGQVGYLLLGFVGLSFNTAEAVILHIAGYSVSNL